MSPEIIGPAWMEWGTAAFARARAGARPVLLSIVTRWSRACRDADRAVFADPAIVETIAASWVPVRVDGELRPDLADRYTLGGWPTIAFLTENGEAIGGGTGVQPGQLAAVLADVSRSYGQCRTELLARPGAPTDLAVSRVGGPDLDAPATLIRGLLSGGAEALSRPPAEAPVAALRVLLRHWAATRDRRIRSLIDAALGGLLDGSLRDPVDGGFYRAALGDGWSEPEPARLLDGNAALALLLAEAAALLDDRRCTEAALGISGYLERTLRHPAAAMFRASEVVLHDDAGPDETREIDSRVFVDGNMRLVSAWLHSGALLGQPGLAEAAVEVLECVLGAAYERGAGVAHCLDPRPRLRGLLGDQVAASGACLDAAEATARTVYSDLAEELMRACLRKYWDPARGAFRDRVTTMAGAGDVGRLAVPHWPFAVNAEAAEVLARLASRTGDAEFARAARAILAAFADEWPGHGADAARYAMALSAVLAPDPS